MQFPYQLVTFLHKEPQSNEPVYYGENGWYVQLALKRRFGLNGINEHDFVAEVKGYFDGLSNVNILTGKLVKPVRMPVKVIDITNQDELKKLHIQFMNKFSKTIISRYPEREGDNYYAHITAEYNGQYIIPVDTFVDKRFLLSNIWLLKDVDGENSIAFAKIV